MSKLSRVIQKVFGETGGVSQFGQFGSNAANPPGTNTKDLEQIQALSQYDAGWFAATANAGEPPRIEDMNSLFLLLTSQQRYAFQAGISEWDANTEYYADHSIVQEDGDIYIALTGADPTPNTGKQPSTNPSDWLLIVSKDGAVNLTGAQSIAGIKSFSSSPVVPNAGIVEDDDRNVAVNAEDIVQFACNPVGGGYAVNRIPLFANEFGKKLKTSGKYISTSLNNDDAEIPTSGAVYNAVWPVGSTYIQFPGDSSPSTLGLPGTWSNVSSELAGDFIRFEGGSALAYNGGQQGFAMQGHWHGGLFQVTEDIEIIGTSDSGSNTGFDRSSAGNNFPRGMYVKDPITNGINGTPQVASETRPVNRTVRKWRRTA